MSEQPTQTRLQSGTSSARTRPARRVLFPRPTRSSIFGTVRRWSRSMCLEHSPRPGSSARRSAPPGSTSVRRSCGAGACFPARTDGGSPTFRTGRLVIHELNMKSSNGGLRLPAGPAHPGAFRADRIRVFLTARAGDLEDRITSRAGPTGRRFGWAQSPLSPGDNSSVYGWNILCPLSETRPFLPRQSFPAITRPFSDRFTANYGSLARAFLALLQ